MQAWSNSDCPEKELCGIPYALLKGEQAIIRKEMEQWLAQYLGEIPLGGTNTYADVPVLMRESQLPALQACTVVLEKALAQVVHHYATDSRIQRIYGLDEEFHGMLALAADVPYNVGAFRPDFLQAANGQLKICEIGARFPLNGWMISYYMERVMAQVSIWKGKKTRRVLHNIPDLFLTLFNHEQPLVLVLDTEQGSEIHWLIELFRQKGLMVSIARPKELSIEKGMCVLQGQPVRQFILEMDRTELKNFTPNVLQYIVRHSTYINDIRTLILVHDKRILAVLYDEAIMRDYLSAEEYAIIRPYLIPSFSLHTAQIRKKYREAKNGWVLKQSSGGRGEGMYMGHECTPVLWQDVITNYWKSYMVQEYVQQHPYHLSTAASNETVHLVGMLLCLNKTFCGPGIFRGSSHEVINVHQGRGLIFPTAIHAA